MNFEKYISLKPYSLFLKNCKYIFGKFGSFDNILKYLKNNTLCITLSGF